MKILLIGGKKFVGYHIAKSAEARGHEIIFFNRGKTYNELFSNIKNIIGDRDKDMELLSGMKFDAVIDTCAYFPKQIEKALDIIKNNIDKYLLISSISAVKAEDMGFDESIDVIGVDYESDEILPETYGPLKAACEEQLVSMIGENKSIIFRPGYIVGERDHTDRFTYWPVMMKHLDNMLIPKTNNLNFKYIDVKDLADFAILALEKSLSGIYHIQGPKEEIKYSDFIHICQQEISPNCQLHELEDEWFKDNKIEKFIAFPTCDDVEEGHVIYSANTQKALNAGLKSRPLIETIRDALNWFMSYKGNVNDLAAGMKADKMKEHIEGLKK